MNTKPDTLMLTIPKQEQLLTVQEYAALVRAHPLSVYRRIREGRQVGVVRVGREYRINISIATKPQAALPTDV
jgi:excisionase family DNA binding protein